MKTLKSLFALVLVFVLAVSMSVTAFATNKQEVVEAARDAGVHDLYVSQLQNVLISKTPSSAVCDQLIAHIENVSYILESHNASYTPAYIKTLTASEQKELVGSLPVSVLRKMETELMAAAKKLDVVVSINFKSAADLRDGDFTITVKDSSTGGSIIVTPNKPVVDTSVDYTTFAVVMGAVLVCALAGAVLVSRKVRN